MNCAVFYQLMANPALLSEQTVPDLKQIVSDFPYFHAARMLYLKNLAVIEDIRQNVELKKMAIHIPDRVKLFMLIDSEQPVQSVVHQKTDTEDNEDSLSVTKTLVSQTKEGMESTKQEDAMIFGPTSLASADYVQFILDDTPTPTLSSPKLQHQELIDSFIQNEQIRSQSRFKFEPSQSDSDSDEMMKEFDHPVKSLDDAYFTEILANIYIKQKRYDKALEIIKSLSLKYPKKNVYFADQIRYLEKLIIHTKK